MSADRPAMWARAQGPAYVIDTGGKRYTFHRISEPVASAPVLRVYRGRWWAL